MIIFFQKTSRKVGTITRILRAVVTTQKSFGKTLAELKERMDRYDAMNTSVLSTNTSPGNPPICISTPRRQPTNYMEGHDFPMNSEADLQRVNDFLENSKKDWERLKIEKKCTSDEEAERLHGKPAHRRLVRNNCKNCWS